ncbi:hypothetical protein IU450_22500 [Nocardia abscessus]|uniref:hypothetical protein n=1 Tax=Nocardia abscessus TaxID=120957 RepID=UPI001894C42A|nr:hypothetical protein [Nocardia abscessus]MBF6338643.1 hypothetical protein [Nocardia abscessus]
MFDVVGGAEQSDVVHARHGLLVIFAPFTALAMTRKGTRAQSKVGWYQLSAGKQLDRRTQGRVRLRDRGASPEPANQVI